MSVLSRTSTPFDIHLRQRAAEQRHLEALAIAKPDRDTHQRRSGALRGASQSVVRGG